MIEDYQELTYLSGIIEEAEYITKKSGCDEELVYDYLYYREVFFHLYALSNALICLTENIEKENAKKSKNENRKKFFE